jgi:hypothetical protein
MSLLDTASLIVTPNAGKEGKLYSVVPSNGSGDFTVTRATTATRVNSEGLIELVPYNLLRYSKTFLEWVQNGFISSGHPDPFGGNNARLYQFSDTFNRIALAIPITAGVTYTLSAWIKGVNLIDFRMFVGTNQQVNVQPQIVNGEWIRVSATVTATTTGTYQQSTARVGSSNVQSFYIYGPQLVEGTQAKDYQPTETRLNIPRLDYSLGSCPNLLLEPQRTNLLLRSEEFDNASWTKQSSSVTANATISPSGVQNADKLIEAVGTNEHKIHQDTSPAVLTPYTITIYAKAAERNFLQFVGVSPFPNQRANFNLSNGTLGSVDASLSASIQSVGNGWYRCIITATPTITGTIRVQWNIITSATSPRVESYTGDGVSGLYVWGAQVEAGEYPTSYIPTTSASVTRNADVISKTGISDLIGQTEGTIFVDFYNTKIDTISRYIYAISSGNSTDFNFEAFITASNTLNISSRNNATTQVSVNFGVLSLQKYKIAYSYSENNTKIFVNGTLVFTDTLCSIPETDSIKLGMRSNNLNHLNDNINIFSIWETQLTDQQCIELTTI